MTPTTSDLEQLHNTVRGALAGATAAERKAADSGRHGDAVLNAARVDCFDWVLQRIDEIREQGGATCGSCGATAGLPRIVHRAGCKRCPRCGGSAPLGRWDVCQPCAVDEGWSDADREAEVTT